MNIFSESHFNFKCLIGFICGIVISFIFGPTVLKLSIIGDIYLNLLKLISIPMLICCISTSIININDKKILNKIGLKMILYYLISFIISAIIAFLVAFYLNPGEGFNFINKSNEINISNNTLSSMLLNLFSTNIFSSLANGNIIQIIIFTIIISFIIINNKEESEILIKIINSWNIIISKLVNYIIRLTPIGIFGLSINMISKFESDILNELFKYILTCYSAGILVLLIVIILPLIFIGTNLKIIIKGFSRILLTTITTCSSMATLPTTISTSIDIFKCDKKISNFTLPIGSTIHMCGGSVSFCCLAVFVSNIYGVNLTIPIILEMIICETLINMAAPGIPEGGVVLGAIFLSIFNLPIEVMGIYAGIYRILDILYTSLNVLGDITVNSILNKQLKSL